MLIYQSTFKLKIRYVKEKEKKTITKKQVNYIIKRYRVHLGPWTLKDGLISVNGDVKICRTNLIKLPLKFEFVYGDFIISSNKLETLDGCPSYVAGNFNCYGNNLTSLKYAPNEVSGSFFCHENKLTSLKGCPKVINANFACFFNNLTSLKNGPKSVNGYFYGHHNKLTTLVESPEYIGSHFRIEANEIINLVGCPKEIGGFFGFDRSVSLFMGNQDCKVGRIRIQSYKNSTKLEYQLPQIIVANIRHLPTVFCYMHILSDMFFPDGRVDEEFFLDLILDIKEGFR